MQTEVGEKGGRRESAAEWLRLVQIHEHIVHTSVELGDKIEGSGGDASMDLQLHCRSIQGGNGVIQWTQSLTAERLSGTKPAWGNLRGLVVLGGEGGHIISGRFW